LYSYILELGLQENKTFSKLAEQHSSKSRFYQKW